MQPQLSLDQKLNFLTVEILEALGIYPTENTTDLIESIISEHFENIRNNHNTLPKIVRATSDSSARSTFRSRLPSSSLASNRSLSCVSK